MVPGHLPIYGLRPIYLQRLINRDYVPECITVRCGTLPVAMLTFHSTSFRRWRSRCSAADHLLCVTAIPVLQQQSLTMAHILLLTSGARAILQHPSAILHRGLTRVLLPIPWAALILFRIT